VTLGRKRSCARCFCTRQASNIAGMGLGSCRGFVGGEAGGGAGENFLAVFPSDKRTQDHAAAYGAIQKPEHLQVNSTRPGMTLI